MAAEYFPNVSLSGSPVETRSDDYINFDWGNGSPGAGIPNDNFSARWSQDFYFDDGTYRFHAVMDDGMRVYLDGNLLLDEWRDGGTREVTFEGRLSTGQHNLRVEYYERTGGAVARFWWEKIDGFTEWKGEYWSNPRQEGNPVRVRNDSNIDFSWGTGSPDGAVPADSFSARWSRDLYFDPGFHRFTVEVDDGARVWLDGVVILDAWQDGTDRIVTADVDVSQGMHAVRVDFYERTGGARMRFNVERLTVTATVTPAPPTPTPTTTATATPTENLTPIPLPSLVPTSSPTPTPTLTWTPSPTATPTQAPTDTPTSTNAGQSTQTPVPLPSFVPSATPTDEPTATSTPEPTNTPTEAPTEAPTNTPTPEPTQAPTDTATPLPPTATPTVTPTPPAIERPLPTKLPPIEAPTGTVSGAICRPAGTAAPMTLFFNEVNTGAVVRVNVAASQDNYLTELIGGTYLAYTWLNDGSDAAGYTAAVVCGLGDACTDHTLQPITVTLQRPATGIDICDWQAEDVPPMGRSPVAR
ncbi:MAG: PA14 domain-containing protein [Caldilineaceae bacterium]